MKGSVTSATKGIDLNVFVENGNVQEKANYKYLTSYWVSGSRVQLTRFSVTTNPPPRINLVLMGLSRHKIVSPTSVRKR